MRILLVKAGRVNSIDTAALPPLGILYLIAWLRRCGQDDVRMVDLQVDCKDDYIRALRDWSPQLVGISALTMEATLAHELAAQAKQLAGTGCQVVMGGPHATSYAREVLEDMNFDAAVLHEGEVTFEELARRLECGEDLAAVDGIAYRDSAGAVCVTKPRGYVKELDSMPWPAWDLVDFSKYEKYQSMSIIGLGQRVAPIFSSRACPYQCTYCHDTFGKQFHKRSVANVLDELQMLVDSYGIRHFEFVDDIFNLDRARTRSILQGIIDRKLEIKLAFPNGLRGDLLDDDLIELFVRAGTEYVCLAVETASPRLQKFIKKHLDLDKIQATIQGFVKRRVFTNCFYMLGFPTETVEEMRLTVDFACRQPAHTSLFFIATPFQGTELAVQASGQSFHKEFERFTYFRSNFNLSENIPTPLLYRTAKLAYFKFFANPARLWRIMRDVPEKKRIWAPLVRLTRKIAFDNFNDRSAITRLRRLAGMDPQPSTS